MYCRLPDVIRWVIMYRAFSVFPLYTFSGFDVAVPIMQVLFNIRFSIRIQMLIKLQLSFKICVSSNFITKYHNNTTLH